MHLAGHPQRRRRSFLRLLDLHVSAVLIGEEGPRPKSCQVQPEIGFQSSRSLADIVHSCDRKRSERSEMFQMFRAFGDVRSVRKRSEAFGSVRKH